MFPGSKKLYHVKHNISQHLKNVNHEKPQHTTTYRGLLNVCKDDGQSYTIPGIPSYNSAKQASDRYVDAFLYKFTDKTSLDIGAYTNTTADISIELHFESVGPANSIGEYKVIDGVYKQQFQRGLTYTVVGGTNEVITATSSNLTGTFTIQLNGSLGSKTVTGSYTIAEHLFQ